MNLEGSGAAESVGGQDRHMKLDFSRPSDTDKRARSQQQQIFKGVVRRGRYRTASTSRMYYYTEEGGGYNSRKRVQLRWYFGARAVRRIPAQRRAVLEQPLLNCGRQQAAGSLHVRVLYCCHLSCGCRRVVSLSLFSVRRLVAYIT